MGLLKFTGGNSADFSWATRKLKGFLSHYIYSLGF